MQRVTYTIDGTDYPINLEYDDLGRTDQIHYPSLGSGKPIIAKYLYDTSGVLTGLDEVGSGTAKSLWRVNSVFQGHLIQDESFGNGATTTYAYDPDRRWLNSIHTHVATAQIQSLEYTARYKNGLVHNLTDANASPIEYLYDNLNRLSSVNTLSDVPTGTPYSYDEIGNLTGRGATVTKYRDAQPHLVDTVGENTYLYDANGNVSSRTGPDIPSGSQLLEYTPFDLPTAITTGGIPSTNTVRFDYSADEERVVRRDLNSTRHFVAGLYQRKLDSADTTLEERFRLYAGDRQIGEIVRKDGADQTLFFHTDHLGSTSTLSDGSGASFQQHFDPFGAPLDPPNPELTRVGFTGQDEDIDLGLTDMKGRIYDPLAGRFMNADPVMQAPFWSQGLNRYSYVFNNPINNTDPSGFSALGEESNDLGIAAGAFGAAAVGGAALVSLGSAGGIGVGAGILGGNVGLPFATGQYGLFNGSSASTHAGAAPTAAPKSSGLNPRGPAAVGEVAGGVGAAKSLRRPPNSCSVGMCLAQSNTAGEGAPSYEVRNDGTGGGVPATTRTIVDDIIAFAGGEITAAINIIIYVEQFRRSLVAENVVRIKAPGVPTAADGYSPPKNWNGQVVRSPNSKAPQYGYPDSKGRVWVPTGTGPAAHGGPHWDVQEPGGGYTNVYPGGGTR